MVEAWKYRVDGRREDDIRFQNLELSMTKESSTVLIPATKTEDREYNHFTSTAMAM